MLSFHSKSSFVNFNFTRRTDIIQKFSSYLSKTFFLFFVCFDFIQKHLFSSQQLNFNITKHPFATNKLFNLATFVIKICKSNPFCRYKPLFNISKNLSEDLYEQFFLRSVLLISSRFGLQTVRTRWTTLILVKVISPSSTPIPEAFYSSKFTIEQR